MKNRSGKLLFFLIVIAFFFLPFALNAQSITWQRVLNNNYGSITKIQQTYDGGYIAVGSDLINGEPKIYLIKFDYLGNTFWTKIYGVGYTRGNWVEETSDRGFIIGGSIDSGQFNDNAYIVKTDSLGNLIWHKTYDISDLDQCYCVKQTSDNGFILSCRYFPDVVGTLFIRIDSLGNIIWQKIYYNSNFHIQAFRQIEILSNGYISIGNFEEISGNQSDVYIMRLDINGDTLWSKRYGGSVTQEVGYSIDRIGNTGYIIAGYSVSYNPNSTNAYLVKIDSSGNFVWQREYNTGLDERCYSVIYKQNTGFVMAGAADTNVINHFNARIRVVDTAGNTLNVKSFFPDTRGGWFNDISQTTDGGYIVGGASNGATSVKMYAVKTDSLLFANPIAIINNSNQTPENFVLYQNYPNPFNPETNIKFDIPEKSSIELKVYDAAGRLVNTIYSGTVEAGRYTFDFNASDISSGVYFYELKSVSKTGVPFREVKKMVLLK